MNLSPNLETRDPKLETAKPETRNLKLGALNAC
jgi:hypothetical protein